MMFCYTLRGLLWNLCHQRMRKALKSHEGWMFWLNKDSIKRDERRLTELGWRTIEIFVLAHIFRPSKRKTTAKQRTKGRMRSSLPQSKIMLKKTTLLMQAKI